jgi:hypothetical protein
MLQQRTHLIAQVQAIMIEPGVRILHQVAIQNDIFFAYRHYRNIKLVFAGQMNVISHLTASRVTIIEPVVTKQKDGALYLSKKMKVGPIRNNPSFHLIPAHAKDHF